MANKRLKIVGRMVDPDGNELIDSSGNFVGDLEVESGDAIVDSSGNEMLEFTVTASAVNHIGISNTGTGVSPVFTAEGEANTGFTFVNSEAEEILILDSVATSVNELTIRSAATGNNPIVASTGEADNGIEFHNDQAEEILILASAATSVNEVTVTSAATGAGPSVSATGDDTNIDLLLTPKGSGAVNVGGGMIYSDITTSSGAGAVAITGASHEVTTTGTGDALTLANGTAGQRLSVVYVAEGAGGDTAVLTPTTFAGGATITFNALGDSAYLEYHTTGGWYMMGGTAAVA